MSKELFSHPLLRSFIYLVWSQSRMIYLINLILYMIFVILLTATCIFFTDVVQCRDLTVFPKLQGLCASGADGRLSCNIPLEQAQDFWSSSNDGYSGEGPGSRALECSQARKNYSALYHHCPSLKCHKGAWRFTGFCSGNKDEDMDPTTFRHIIDCFQDTNTYSTFLILSGFTMALWFWLLIRELLQAVHCGFKLSPWNYILSLENLLEFVILFLSIYFWIAAHYSNVRLEKLFHIGGWCMFLAWVDLTLFLGRLPKFGPYIYMSLNVTTALFWGLSVYLPTLMAFASAFHMFLSGSDLFRGFASGFMKTFVMMVGEFEFSDYFVYHKVYEFGGRNWSVQVSNYMNARYI